MHVGIMTPWYPDPTSVYLGVFVKQQVDALLAQGTDVSVEVPHLFPAPAGSVPNPVVESIEHLATTSPDAIYWSDGEATWIPVLQPARSGYSGRADAFLEALRQKRSIRPLDVDLMHAHLGVPTAWAAIELGDAPLVVTEHQSTLPLVLREPAARAKYADVVERSDRFFVVSAHLRDLLASALGSEAVRDVEVMPNIVDLSDISFVERSHERLSNWVYVGAMLAHKGASLLVRSFIEYRTRHDPDATLTVVGGGDMADWARRYCASKDAGEALHVVGSVPHSELARWLAGADVFVHMSPAETFGIASLEAIGAGLPVVSLRNGGSDNTWGAFEEIAGTILANDASPTDVADAVAALQSDAARLDLWEARREVGERYSPERVASLLTMAYREVLS